AGPFAAAVRAAAKRAQLRRELGLRVAAFSPQDPSLIGELSAEWAYEELGSLLRGLSPAAWSTAAEVLRERVDTLGKWDAGGGRALARLAALGRGDPTREGLARAHGLRLLRVSGARARLLELARLKAAAGARELLLAVLDALQAPDPPPPEEHDAWRAITLALTLPLDDALATRLPRPAWGVELATLARLAPPPPLPEGPLAERMRAAAEQAAAALIASPGGAEPACVPWLAQALEHATDSADHWAPAVAALARELEPGPIHERLRASALSRRDTFGPEALVALRELVSALPAPELAQQLLDLELRFALLPPVERGDTPAPTAAAWRALLALASAAQGPAALWTRVGAAVSAGDVALEALEELGALPLAHALDGLSGGFSLRIQNELQQLVLRLAAGDDPDRLAVTVRAVIARSQGDRELRQRLGAQLQAALEQAPGLRTPSVFEALRALLK
ncbi:MAG: hypothetical protein KDD82_29800, partial [Planctomycetes bacterium]|nr:hypothetical protein [Planctomycetota bacterium]